MSLTLQSSTDSSGVDAATRINTAMGAVDEKVSGKLGMQQRMLGMVAEKIETKNVAEDAWNGRRFSG